jgi:uncharacterized membrane protein
MAILIVLFGAWLMFREVGARGVEAFGNWHDSARYALAVMFGFTGMAHFTKMKHDLARMVPSVFPAMPLVYFTGVCEWLGAVGLLVARTREFAAVALIVMMIAMFPANIKAARERLTLRGKRATALWLRVPLQVLFIGLLWWVRR